LRGTETFLVRREQAGAAARILKKKTDRPALAGAAAGLFEALRAERARLAREQNVPAYVIFHDATLAAIAQARPASLAALADIAGMGRTKLERYGETVLAVVRGQA
jgi:ATP-dependent DNA helicase RecQ